MSVKIVKLSDIRENPVALRAVDRQSEEFQGLVDSIAERGVLNAISLREKTDPETKALYYELIDGLHRYMAALDAGLKEIPAQILSLNDTEVLEAQVVANIHKIETKPIEYTKQLMRMLASNPLMTEAELAKKIAKSPAYIASRLGLLKLTKSLQPLVDEGKINLSNAYALAKLPEEEQLDFSDRAMTQTPQEFVAAVNSRVKEIRDAKRSGRDAEPAKFEATPKLQKIKDIKAEIEQPKIRDALFKANGIKDPAGAYAIALNWAIHMDKDSIAAAQARDEARKKDMEDAKKSRAAERADKKAKEAAAKAAELQAAAKKGA